MLVGAQNGILFLGMAVYPFKIRTSQNLFKSQCLVAVVYYAGD